MKGYYRIVIFCASLGHAAAFALFAAIKHPACPDTGSGLIDNIALPIGAFTWGVLICAGIVQFFDHKRNPDPNLENGSRRPAA